MAQLKDLIVSGPARIIGDLYGSNIYATTFTGGLNGTASNAVTAGGATTASQATHAQTAHYATSATYAASAGSAATATNAAHSQTAHYATSATYSASAGSATSASGATTAGNAVTAGYATTAARAGTAGYAITASRATTAARAGTAGYATTAGYAETSNTSNYALFAYDFSRIAKDFILAGEANYNATTDVITRTSMSSAHNYDTGAYSKTSHYGCCIDFKLASELNHQYSSSVGLAAHITESDSSLIDNTQQRYHFQFYNTSTLIITINSDTVMDTFSPTDSFRIEYSNQTIKYYRNFECIYTCAVTSPVSLYGFCQLRNLNDAFKDLTFSPIPICSIGCVENPTGVLTLGSF